MSLGFLFCFVFLQLDIMKTKERLKEILLRATKSLRVQLDVLALPDNHMTCLLQVFRLCSSKHNDLIIS